MHYHLRLRPQHHRLRAGTRAFLHRARPPQLVAFQVQDVVLHTRHGWTRDGTRRVYLEDVFKSTEPIRGHLFRDSVLLHRCCAGHLQRE